MYLTDSGFVDVNGDGHAEIGLETEAWTGLNWPGPGFGVSYCFPVLQCLGVGVF